MVVNGWTIFKGKHKEELTENPSQIDFANVVLLENETKVMAHNRVIKEAYAALTDEEKAAYSTEASLKVEKKIKESTEDVKLDFEKRPARIKQLRTTLMTTMARLANEVGVEVIGFWIDPYSSDTTGISIESFGPKALYDLLPNLDKTEVKKIFKENQPKSTQLERVYVTEGRKVPVTRPPLYPNESDFAKHVSRQDQLLSFVRNHFHYRYDLLMRKLAGTGPKKREYLFPWGKFSQGRKSGDPIGNDQIAVLGWPEDIIFPSKSDSLPMQNLHLFRIANLINSKKIRIVLKDHPDSETESESESEGTSATDGPTTSKEPLKSMPKIQQASSKEPPKSMPKKGKGNVSNAAVDSEDDDSEDDFYFQGTVETPKQMREYRELLSTHRLIPNVASLSDEEVINAYVLWNSKLPNPNFPDLCYLIYHLLWDDSKMASGLLISSYSNLIARHSRDTMVISPYEMGPMAKRGEVFPRSCYVGEGWGRVPLPTNLNGLHHVLLPILLNEHWILIYWDLEASRMNIWDSLDMYDGSSGRQVHEMVQTACDELHYKYFHNHIVETTFKLRPYDTQEGFIDCGYFVCAYMRHILGFLEINVARDMRSCMKIEFISEVLNPAYIRTPILPMMEIEKEPEEQIQPKRTTVSKKQMRDDDLEDDVNKPEIKKTKIASKQPKDLKKKIGSTNPVTQKGLNKLFNKIETLDAAKVSEDGAKDVGAAIEVTSKGVDAGKPKKKVPLSEWKKRMETEDQNNEDAAEVFEDEAAEGDTAKEVETLPKPRIQRSKGTKKKQENGVGQRDKDALRKSGIFN